MKPFVHFAVALGLCLIGLGGAAHAQDAATAPASRLPPTIAEFAAEPAIAHVAVSPGGGHVAFVMRNGEDVYIVVKATRAEDEKPTVARLGAVRVYGLKWVNDDRLIYSMGAKEVGVSVKRGRIVFTGVPRLVAIDRDLKQPLVFFKDDKKISQANVITTSDINLITGNSEHFIVPLRVGRNLDLVKVNVRDGTWTTIAGGAERTFDWFVDLYGNPVMRFDANLRYTEARVMIPQRRKDDGLDWKHAFSVRFDTETGEPVDFDPIAPGPQPGLYYVTGRPAGADRTGVYLYNLQTQTYGSEVFSHPRLDVDGGIVDPRTGAYIGASYWDDRLEVTFNSKKMQTHFNALQTFFERQESIVFVDRSADQQMWVVVTYGPQDPGVYHIYDMANTHSEVLGSINPLLGPDRLGKTEPIAYKARDGMEMKGYLTLPPGLAKDAKPPLIVFPHGGPEARNELEYDTVVQFLATRGYAVFQPNFRGSSGYGKAFVEAGNHQFGGAIQTDITDGVQALIDQGRVDAERMCIFGESFGGYAALMGAAQFPDLYRCAVSSAGVSDLDRQVRWEKDQEGRDSEAYKYWVAKIGDPDRDKAAIAAASPIRNIPAIHIPILLMHGKEDETVPFEQSDLMQQALKKAGKDSKIVVFEGAGHNLRYANLEDYLTQLEQFLGKHLGMSVSQ